MALGASAQAQQAQKASKPSEQITVRAAKMTWDEMLQVQASLPQLGSEVVTPQVATIEIPPTEVSLVDGKLAIKKRPELPANDVMKTVTSCTGFTTEPPLGTAFDSQLDVADGAGFSFIPPDIGGGVGPEHLMTMLNNKVLITDRVGGSPVAVDTSLFWIANGTTPLSPTTVYPRVWYDNGDDRWLATARDGTGGAMKIMFAISDTDDPTGSWDFYAITADGTGATFPDWVLMGYNSNWVTITANMFNVVGGASAGNRMWVVDKTTALAGGSITVSVFNASTLSTNHSASMGSSLHPSRDLDGSNSDMFCVNDSFVFTYSSPNRVWLLQLTQITGTPSSPTVLGYAGSPFGGNTGFCIAGTNWASTQRTMAQLAPEARFISAFSVRIASVAMRNGKIWVANSGGQPGPVDNPGASVTSNGVIWHELDPTLPFPGGFPVGSGTMVVQSGAVTNGLNTMSLYPSIAVNCAEDVLLGYSNGDSTRYPRACYSMRLSTDPAGFMGPVNELKAGESNYWKNFGVGTTAQWGRYTATSVDPLDDKTLWTLQEYADTRVGPADNDSRWGTHWGRLGDCEKKPEITVHPMSQAVCVGNMVTFSVTATSSLPITYQWRKDNVDIPGATTSSYVIASAVGGDLGAYDCVVCSCGMRTSNAANLTFNGATFPTQPVTVKAALYTPASFNVVASGTGTLFYQWHHDGSPISGATTNTYSIASVVAADYGDYYCEVTDDCGPVTSDTAALQPPNGGFNKFQLGSLSLHIFSQPEDTIGCVGSPMSLSIVAEPDGIAYQWSKNGIPVGGATNSVFTIASYQASDAGNYRCTVSIGIKSKTSDVAVVTTGDDPVVTLHPLPVSQTVPPGSFVSYTCAGTGAGTVHYQWRKKPATPFSSFANIPGAKFPTLNLGEVTTSDGGQYRCVLSNLCGATTTNIATLNVAN